MSGFINYLDKDNPDKPIRVLRVGDTNDILSLTPPLSLSLSISLLHQGQNKNLTSLAVSADASTIYAGSVEGRVNILYYCSLVNH